MPIDSNKIGAYGTWVVGFSGLLWGMFTYFNPKPEPKKVDNQRIEDTINHSNNSVNETKTTNSTKSTKQTHSNNLPSIAHTNKELSQYFSYSGIENTLDKEEIAILILNESDKIEYDLEVKIVDKLLRNGFGATAKFFKNQFISAGLFDKLYDGDRELLRSLNIHSHADYIFLGKLSLNYRDNDQNLKTSIGKLSGVILNTQNGNIIKQVSINERGEGFYEDDSQESTLTKITQLFPVNF
jgi:hypothetical protein